MHLFGQTFMSDRGNRTCHADRWYGSCSSPSCVQKTRRVGIKQCSLGQLALSMEQHDALQGV